MNGVGRITENKWMRRLRSDLRIVLDLILRSDLRFGPAQNKHLVVRTDGHWPFRASGLLEPLARLAKEGEKICRASGQCRGLGVREERERVREREGEREGRERGEREQERAGERERGGR